MKSDYSISVHKEARNCLCKASFTLNATFEKFNLAYWEGLEVHNGGTLFMLTIYKAAVYYD